MQKLLKQDPVVNLFDYRAGIAAGERAKRIAGPNRRAQLLRTASAQFATTGLNGTTTLAVAQAAGLSEAILFAHFGDKTQYRDAPALTRQSSLLDCGGVWPVKLMRS